MNLFTDNDVMSSPAETDLPAINAVRKYITASVSEIWLTNRLKSWEKIM